MVVTTYEVEIAHNMTTSLLRLAMTQPSASSNNHVHMGFPSIGV